MLDVKHLYDEILIIDRKIENLEISKKSLSKKISKQLDPIKVENYIQMAKCAIAKIEELQLDKNKKIEILSKLTPIVKIDLFKDPYLKKNLIESAAFSSDKSSPIHLYASLLFEFTIVTSEEIKSIKKSISLDDFEQYKNIQQKYLLFKSNKYQANMNVPYKVLKKRLK